MENNEQQIQTPQGTQLYKNIGDLMDIVAERYEKEEDMEYCSCGDTEKGVYN